MPRQLVRIQDEQRETDRQSAGREVEKTVAGAAHAEEEGKENKRHECDRDATKRGPEEWIGQILVSEQLVTPAQSRVAERPKRGRVRAAVSDVGADGRDGDH